MEQQVEQEVAEINKKVTSILTLLRGNELDKTDTGMAGMQEDHERLPINCIRRRDRLEQIAFL